MERVAISLQAQAVDRRGNPKEADMFGRSAFNRYYYAIFYIVREMLTDFSADWRTMKHASVPMVLDGQIKDRIHKAKQKANRLGDREAVAICSHGLTSLRGLKELLERGYSVRSTADYDSSVPLMFVGKSTEFKLGETTIATARQWVERTNFLTSSVRRAWKLADES